jgi:hypothetical protein
VLFLGHIAVSLVLADLTGSDRGAAVAGNLLPDVVDKTGGWVLRVMPSGRWFAHGLPSLASTVALARLVLPPRHWRGFSLGYAGHLLGDLYGGGRVPWLAPFSRPPARKKRDNLLTFTVLAPEVVGGLVIWWRLAKAPRPAEARSKVTEKPMGYAQRDGL